VEFRISASSRVRAACVGTLLLAFAGCATVAPPVKRAPVKPFKADQPPGTLRVTCSTGELGGCSAINELKNKTAEYAKLHAVQMAALEKQLQEVARILSTPESVPLASIEADEPKTEMWTDPEGVYPATMTVRFEYSRGLDRLGEGVQVVLKTALTSLKATAAQSQADWGALVRESRTAVPVSIAAERTPAQLVVNLVDLNLTIALPMQLAARYLKREALPWAAVASHVVTEGRLKHKLVQEHPINVQPALTVSAQVGASGLTVTITETPAKRLRGRLKSEIPAGDFCKKLRAELRFMPAGHVLSRKVEFVSADKAGGAK
jgi:hypothetical protein